MWAVDAQGEVVLRQNVYGGSIAPVQSLLTTLQTVHFVKGTPERAEKSGPTARRERIEPFAGS